MRVRIFFVTSSQDVADFVSKRQLRVLPIDLLHKFPYSSKETSVLPVFWSRLIDEDKLIARILDASHNAGAVLVVHDGSPGFSPRFRDAFYCSAFDPSFASKNMQNYFSMFLAKVMKKFSIYLSLFARRDDMQKFLLPLLNFQAPELGALRGFMHHNDHAGDFAEQLQALLAALNGCKHPKSRKADQKDYFVDDIGSFFRMGFEAHAEAETKNHEMNCIANKTFRYGAKYGERHHFNVSNKNEMLVERWFYSCHGETQNLLKRKHLNVFPNDYIT